MENKEFQRLALDKVNELRKLHGIYPLEWSDDLSIEAYNVCRLMSMGKLHSKLKSNYLMMKSNEDLDAETVIDEWYHGIYKYNFKKPKNDSSKKEFMCLIWASAQRFGIWKEIGKDRKVYISAIITDVQITDSTLIHNMFPIRYQDCTKKVTSKNLSVVSLVQKVQMIDMIINYHNQLREIHVAEPLFYSATLSQSAEEFAKEITLNRIKNSNDKIEPSDWCGRNIIFARGSIPTSKYIVSRWYNGERIYDYTNGTFDERTGGFSQIVWKSSKLIGVGLCYIENYFTLVCFYYPQGNVKNEFEENVLPPKSSTDQIVSIIHQK